MHSSSAATIHDARDLSPSTFTTTQVSPTSVAEGSSLRETVSIKQGIDSDLGRKISKEVKSAKMKVQLTIQGNELRVIAFIKDMKNSQPLQFVNYRD